MGINKETLPVVGAAYYCTDFYFFQSNSRFNITCKIHENTNNQFKDIYSIFHLPNVLSVYGYSKTNTY